MNYDYIIIGAGSAGCILANRLSADPSKKVLLVEAGGKDSKMEIHIPAGYGKLHKSDVDWNCYWTAPQTHVLNRKIYLPRGKVLGGSSSTNAMAYVRGNKEDYNDWAALGNMGWAYNDVLPYFKKSEHNEDIRNEYHGQNGELNVTFPKQFKTAFPEPFIEACMQCGFEKNDDYNGAKQEGVGWFQFNIKNGKRHSSASAFIKPIENRENLTILLNTQVHKIVIEKDKAVAIEASTGKNAPQILKATREIIVSAGSFASPQLLMLSGIGNQDELLKLGITVVKHLPGVGKNLQDHLFYPIGASATMQKGQNHHIKPFNQLIDLLYYLFFKKGALTISPLEAVAFGSTSLSPDRVDYQLHFAAFNVGESYDFDIYDLNSFPKTDGFTILPTLLRPKSRGYVALKSLNPADAPIIQPNFLSEEADKKVLLESGRKALDIIQASAFDKYRQSIVMPSANCSDDALLYHILRIMETVYHPVGTCKMGNDEMAVVDNQLRVYGIENLRVIDASIMPTIVSGNTNAPVYMIAEKGADMII